MKCMASVIVIWVAVGAGAAAQASEILDAVALKNEAMDVLRANLGGDADPVVYAGAIKKLEQAESLLEKAKASDPITAESLESEVSSARFWAQKFATIQTADVLNGKKPTPAPSRAAPGVSSTTDAPAAAGSAPAPASEPPDLRAQAAQLRQEGRFDEAKAKLKEYLAILDASSGGSADVSSLAKIRDYFFDEGSYSMAEVYAKRVVDAMEKRLGLNHPFLALDLTKQADNFQALSKYTQAEAVYKRVLTIREKFLGAEHPDVASTLDKLGHVYCSQNKWDLAETHFKRGLTIRKKALKAGDLEIAKSLIGLEELYKEQGKYADAETQGLSAIKLLEDALGPEHALIGQPLGHLGLIYIRQGRFDDAEKFWTRSLNIAEKSSGPDHPNTAWSLNGLANLRKDEGKYAQASELYQRALAIREKTLGADHVDVGITLMNLGGMISPAAKGEEYLKRALSIFQNTFGNEHALIVKANTNLAGVYRTEGRYTDSETILLQTKTMAEKIHGPNHESGGFINCGLGLTYFGEGKFTQAEPYYKRAIAIFESSLGPKSVMLQNSLTMYSQDLRKLNRNAEADQLDARAKAIAASRR